MPKLPKSAAEAEVTKRIRPEVGVHRAIRRLEVDGAVPLQVDDDGNGTESVGTEPDDGRREAAQRQRCRRIRGNIPANVE
jgi:hypothetical protein